MSTATKTLVSVILRGNRFELRSRYDASLLAFYRSLPNARFNQLGEFWTCDATPSAAAKICRETPAEVQAENAVRELAARFIEGVNAPLPREQPPVRKADLRRHQVAGYHFAMQRDSALLAHEMGSGKSFTTVAVVNNRNCRAVMILCPVSVRGVWRREFAKWSAINYEVIVLEKGTVARKIKEAAERTLLAEAHGKPFVVVTNYESARDKKFVAWAKLRKWDMVIADECFPAGTVVSTPSGEVSIEDVRVGDQVYGVNHDTGELTIETVLHCFRKTTSQDLIEVNGVWMTPEHPVWTQERGYVPAREVRNGETTCEIQEDLRVVQGRVHGNGSSSEVLRQVVFFKAQCNAPRSGGSQSESDASGDFSPRCTEETTGSSPVSVESVPESRGAEEVRVSRKGEAWLQNAQRWKWEGSDRTSEEVGGEAGVWMGDGIRCFNESVVSGVSVSLQVGHRESGTDDLYRSGRAYTQVADDTGEGSEEDGVIGIARMDGDPFLESPDFEGSGRVCSDSEREIEVYNLETTSGNYFAGRMLVHNCHRAKSHDSSTSKQLAEIGKYARFRLALTGTPMPHSPLDIFGQFRFLDAGIFGTSFTAFRGEYAITGALGAYHIVGFRNLEQLAQRMKLLTHEVKMSDTDIELPPVSHIRRSCEIEDRKGYDDLCEEMIAQVDDGTITAANALVKLLRLQQWTSGCVVDDDGVERMTGAEKRGLLEDLLQDLPVDRPVVVFCNFIRSLDIVAEVVTKSGRKFGEISGRRKDLTANSEFPPDVDVLAVQYQAGGVGIDLTRANYAICYDHTWNMGNNDQAMARVHRPGQVHPTFIYHLIVENTIDDIVVRALEKKRDVVEGVLEFLRGGVV